MKHHVQKKYKIGELTVGLSFVDFEFSVPFEVPVSLFASDPETTHQHYQSWFVHSFKQGGHVQF